MLDEHEGGINCMALSDDCSVLATGSEDRTARIWTTKTERCECIGVLKGHDDYINCVSIEESFVLTGSADKTVRKWDMGTCDCLMIYRGHNSLVNRIISTGDFIFSSSYDRTARCWDFDTGECIRVFSGHKRGVYPLIFIPDDDEESASNGTNNDVLVTGSADFTARSWSFESGKCLQKYEGHGGAVTCMATDPMGHTLMTGSVDQTVRSWDIKSGEPLKVFTGHQASIICMTVVNKIMYTGSSDHTGRSWVLEFGDCTRVFKGHHHTVSCIRYHEGLIFTGCGDAVARCYDAKSGVLKRQFHGHEVTVNTMQVIVGDRLFTGSHDSTLRMWDISGISDDTMVGGKTKIRPLMTNDPEKPPLAPDMEAKPEGNGKILIDEDENMNMNGQNGQNEINNDLFYKN
ncbi:hypothetical protein CAPTEDRAFT_115707 [Capitella teleta]|uniref:Uncharacterized protein n=1 Tax=Capitella teleta TaxID=283909 RepID=R7V165_CAPTE|nr:hypothetical protein CAPTEDRAFT_115707 [Capitella teleta]|eukprot:ELU09441.1 hypothetical protein CAPTEDRAFT_115707 [Capitella teleta]